MRPREAARPYQLTAEEFISSRRRGQLWADVGLGKTAIFLSVFELLFRQARAYRVLVLAPKAIAVDTWQQEAGEWEHLAELQPEMRSLVGLSAKERAYELFHRRRTRIDTLNYDHIGWLEQELKKRDTHLGLYYDAVICDEITRLKSASSKRFAAMSRIVHPSHVPLFWGLTGTPVSEGYRGVWAPMYLVDYGHRLGGTEGEFLRRHFLEFNGVPRLMRGHDQRIQDAIKDVVLVLDAREYGVLPSVRENVVKLHLPVKAQNMYDELERDMMTQLQRGGVLAANAGVLVGKCAQLTSGAMFLHDAMGRPTKEWEVVHDVKLEALDTLFGELNGRNLLVAVNYTHETTRIKDKFSRVAVHMTSANAERVKPDWNAGKIRMLVAHPKSCGHGLNLQAGGADIAFFTLPWSHELYDQIIGRLRRTGQQARSVGVHVLMMDNTVDYDIWHALHHKADVQDTLKERLRLRGVGSRAPSLAA